MAGESHRIYWQQWPSESRTSRRELVTSSAAVRITSAARASDVTQLLRTTLHLTVNNKSDVDSLVLVGTLYSLPSDYVRFEHEQPKSFHGVTSVIASPYSSPHSRSDPFHIIQTLQPEQSPLQVRDQMKERLSAILSSAPATRTIISPKMQWFYVPSSKIIGETQILGCIDLDGYATSMDAETSDNDIDETDYSNESENETTSLEARFSWLQTSDTFPPRDTAKLIEEQRLQELILSSTSNQTISGYLLKRSRHDPNVWRRVHCVLTDDYLWYISRVYHSKGFAKHRRIKLTQALLLEPSSDYAPLFRIPYAFEIVSRNGISHIFRAPSKALQIQWIKLVSDRIVESFENSLLEQPELLIEDECFAKNRRWSKLSVEPVWEAYQSQQCVEPDSNVALVLWFGILVANYREKCRTLQLSLPAKTPIVASSPSTPLIFSKVGEALDSRMQEQVQALWDTARSLLDEATRVAQILPESRQKVHRSTETLCRHIEYVLTGCFRTMEDNGTVHQSNGVNSEKHQQPPPIDLFDALLRELELIAAGADASDITPS